MDSKEAQSIGVQDLQQVLAIIDVASKRGAFTDPKEYAEIGRVYTKLNNFVTHAIERSKDEAEKSKSGQSNESTNKKGNKDEQA